MTRPLVVLGHTHELVVRSMDCEIGGVARAIAFEFVDCGGTQGMCARVERPAYFGTCLMAGVFAIPLEDLRELVDAAERAGGGS